MYRSAVSQRRRSHVLHGYPPSITPQVQEMTQQQVKALEEEARTRIQADEARAARFGQAVQRVSGEVQSLSGRIAAKESGTLQRVAKLEVRGTVVSGMSTNLAASRVVTLSIARRVA